MCGRPTAIFQSKALTFQSEYDENIPDFCHLKKQRIANAIHFDDIKKKSLISRKSEGGTNIDLRNF